MDYSFQAHILVGPTAVGKTATAHLLATRMNARILSADSMLVYKGMDIGTAKPSRKELELFDYAGVDIVEAGERFNLNRYLEHCRTALYAEQRPVIAVGGTGLYIKALTRGLDDAGAPNSNLRALAEKLLDENGVAALQEYLAEHAPDAYARLKDKQNPRRLVRALESDPATKAGWDERPAPRMAGLCMQRERLAKRIVARVDHMYAAGLLDEVSRLLDSGRLSRTAQQAIGYKEAIAVLAGDIDWEEARERICARTRRLAKSQMTWFRNQEEVDWIELSGSESLADVADRVEDIWRKHGRSRLGI